MKFNVRIIILFTLLTDIGMLQFATDACLSLQLLEICKWQEQKKKIELNQSDINASRMETG